LRRPAGGYPRRKWTIRPILDPSAFPSGRGQTSRRRRQRAAVGIAAGPGLLLVDEPTSQLDARGRDEVVAALETVNAERGTTIVVVTHDGEVGNRLGRAVTIRDGRVGAEGRSGQEFAVVAGDGTVQLPPDVFRDFPPGTLFTVDRTNGSVALVPSNE
jgi:energy-coupling factor transporter ATP-binding protein EcfA2